MARRDPRPWGWRPAVLPCLAVAVLAAAGVVVSQQFHPRSYDARLVASIVLTVVVYGLLGLVVWMSARPIAARYGGWGATFGLRRPEGRDAAYAAAGIGVAFVGRIVVGIVANVATHGQAVRESQNLALHSSTVGADVLLVITVVILAPVIEETIFRGLLLRAFMRRMGFWPAALASTLIFALFHTYEVDTLAGAITLAAAVATLGLTNCVLVRLTDRLAPGMIVHATFNAIAAAVVIYQAGH